ncbi:hypothetical protein ACFOW9_00015 [Arthrobacter cryoconiti]|uniref:PIN domain-containing protein n=2 Tax=Arthrobacter cryoconiti TaxID=748907 RepID=A0ABV8QY31_9MICC|nr:hypothetical protein [Arthrobacter cryoconiti]MCC9069772.1 hypothetical protein [Arthrobacter cryoconiti]
MTAWSRSFGQPDLFSSAIEDDTRVQAVLDTNVVLDLVLERNALTREYFEAPALDGEVMYCTTRSINNELSETKVLSQRRKVMAAMLRFENLASDLDLCEKLTEEVIAEISPRILARDKSLGNDARVLAETITSGASVLLTNDDNAANVLRPIALKHGVEILHPSQLVVMIDKLRDVRDDSPNRIQNTSFTISTASAGADRDLSHLVSSFSGESKPEFMKRIRSTSVANIRVVHATDSILADGIVSTWIIGNALMVDLLRVRRSPLSRTLLKQLVFQLRHEALESGLARILVVDPHPGGGEAAVSVFVDEGAKQTNGNWTFEVVDAQLTSRDLANGLVGDWDVRPWLTQTPETAESCARLERELWPLKILDAPLTCYIVPIRQHFASELLGYDTPLLPRESSLGISRRHVYYKADGIRPQAPGRILWYASGAKGGQIVAASQLLSSHRGRPESLHARFQKYGVWTLTDVNHHSQRTGVAIAIRFGDTEVLRHPVKLSEAESIVVSYGSSLGQVPTARAISAEAFTEIYGRGMNR